MQNWKKCQKLCVGIGEHGLVRRGKDFKIDKLNLEIAARGRLLLSRFRFDDVIEKSLGAATFYSWVNYQYLTKHAYFISTYLTSSQ